MSKNTTATRWMQIHSIGVHPRPESSLGSLGPICASHQPDNAPAPAYSQSGLPWELLLVSSVTGRFQTDWSLHDPYHPPR